MGIPKKRAFIVCLALLSAILLPGAGAQTTLSLAPPTANVSLFSSPTTLRVNTTISSVTNLYGYQYDVQYNQTIFSITLGNIITGPFIGTGITQVLCVDANLTTAPGLINDIACARTGQTNVSGSGNLTTLAFTVNMTIRPTTTKINLASTKLSNIYSQPIAHSIGANGTVNIYECFSGEMKPCYAFGSGTPGVGRCRSGNLTCNATSWWPPMNTTTCVGDVGPVSELCDGIDNDCDGLTDENATGSGNLSRSCSLFHNGTCAVGTEICDGVNYAGCPAPQTEICNDGEDQDCSGGPNNGDSLCPGDVAGGGSEGRDPDGCINGMDLSTVALDFGKTSGFLNNPNSDVDKNGVVDIFDLVYVGKDFGAGCP